MSNITISCQNSFWAAYANLKNSAKHTQNMRTTIEMVMRDIEAVQKAEKTLYQQFFQLAEISVTKEHIQKVVKIALDIDMNGGSKDVTTYQRNRLNELSGAINGEMRQKGATLWGLFSGVTKYTTHIMPGGTDNRKQSKAMGVGLKVDNEVFADLVSVLA